MQAVEVGIIRPQIAGNRNVAVGQRLRNRADDGTDQAKIHIVPCAVKAGRLIINGGEFHHVDREIGVGNVMRGAHVGHKCAKAFHKLGCVRLLEVTLALIPDKTCHCVLFKRIHIVIVHISCPGCVDALGYVDTLRVIPSVALELVCYRIGQECAQGLTVTVDLDDTHGHLALGHLHEIPCKAVADRGKASHACIGRSFPSAVMYHVGANLGGASLGITVRFALI